MLKHELENNGLEDFSTYPDNLLRFSKVHFLFRFFGGGGGNSQNSDETEFNDGYWWSPSAYCVGTGVTATDGCGLNLPQTGVKNLTEPATRATGQKDAVEKLRDQYGGEKCSVCKQNFKRCIVDAWPRSFR